MGQYHAIYNLDKREMVQPHGLDAGAKQVEHTGYEGSLSDVLYALCAYKEARGGGDLKDDGGVFKGRWHGDRVMVIGDYAEEGDMSPEWWAAMCSEDFFADITPTIKPLVEQTFSLRKRMGDVSYISYGVPFPVSQE